MVAAPLRNGKANAQKRSPASLHRECGRQGPRASHESSVLTEKGGTFMNPESDLSSADSGWESTPASPSAVPPPLPHRHFFPPLSWGQTLPAPGILGFILGENKAGP